MNPEDEVQAQMQQNETNVDQLILNSQSANEIQSKELNMCDIFENAQKETQYLSNEATSMTLSRPDIGSPNG